MTAKRARILVVGGYGAFGTLICERLARQPDLRLIVAGRDLPKAETVARNLLHSGAGVSALRVDATDATPATLQQNGVTIIINASGPFQAQDYALARSAIAAGCHYIDLADARTFVAGITVLDHAAKAAGVSVISGASSVPGLSSAAYQSLATRFAQVTSLEIYLSPGNHFNPGEATTRSVLGGAGRPIEMLENGHKRTVYGWQGLCRRTIEGIGPRWFGYVDVPDLKLFPAADGNLQTVRFQAGVEVSAFHLGLWLLAGLKRAGAVSDVGVFTKPLLRAKARLSFLGSDRGGMLMRLGGKGSDSEPLRIDWSLAATHGHGPYIPAMASIILAKRLARDPSTVRPGARPCFGEFTLDEFIAEVSNLNIHTHLHSSNVC